MWDWLSLPAVQVLLALTMLGGVAYMGLQVAVALRPSTSKADTNVDVLAQNFEEMQLEGDISDEELRTIKAVLGQARKKRASD